MSRYLSRMRWIRRYSRLFNDMCHTRVSTDQHFCGGSIISDLFILTAAHYVTNRSVTGRTDLSIVSHMQQREVDRVDIFPDGIDGRVILG